MTEKKIQLRAILKLLVIVIFASLYAWGGMEMKWLRRFLAPAILCLSAFGFSRDWRYLIQMPLMMASLSLGYGATELWEKILRRGIFGFANGASSSFTNIWYRKWLLVGFQIILLISAYIIFGVFNPLSNARAEETLLGLLVAGITILSVKDK